MSSEHLNNEINRLRLELTTLKEDAGASNISIANYLLTRLSQLGVKSMFGVPGDFNLGFLDLVEDHPDIDWVGNCNELNAAYAADGYARLKENSLGVLTTTFGVGELSAINGIAGAFSEMVPIVHIAGVPSTVLQKTKPILHHTLGDGRFDAYRIASQQFVIHEANLSSKETAAAEIDKALVQCLTKARPVYLTLPTDLVYAEISSERLQIPLTADFPTNDPETEEFVASEIYKAVKSVEGHAVILVDACVIRHGVRQEVLDLLKETGFPLYATPMGKTAIDEDHERYGGIYVGELTRPETREAVESAKLIISIGMLKSDFNTGSWSYKIKTENLIELHSDHTKIKYARFNDIGMKHLLPKLTGLLKEFHPIGSKIPVPKFLSEVPKQDHNIIDHKWFWPRLSKFFKPNDVIIAETGTANFGVLDIPLPPGAVMVSQILWGSIGWSVGSALGAALGAREIGKGRVILLVGDGSLQLTAQEFSSMMRKGLTPILIVLNNHGYTIEKFIHGKHRRYNDVANWKYTSLLDTLNDDGKHTTASYTVNDKEEFEKLFTDPTFNAADKIQLVEVIMPALDAPENLIRQADMSSRHNKYSA